MAAGEVGPAGQHSKYHFNGPSVPTGKKKFHQSAQRLSPAGGTGGWEGREAWSPTVGTTDWRKGCSQKQRKKKMSKGKDGSGP